MDAQRPNSRFLRDWTLPIYAAMLASGVALFLAIRNAGQSLVAPAPAGVARFGGPGAAAAAHSDSLLQLLVALAVVLAAARGVGLVFRYLHQPQVVGEVIAGILLGPTVLGHFAPSLAKLVFPASVTPLLGVFSQIGVLLYMFLVGLELNVDVLRERTQTTVAISHASIQLPFLLGTGLALWLYPQLSSSDVPFTAFALFLGVSMSVTAFPVLARILTDREMHRTRMGTVALTCAAIDDVTAWCLLALVVGVVEARVAGAGRTIVLTVLYGVAMFGLVRPLAIRYVGKFAGKPVPVQQVMAVTFFVLLLSSLATEYIGIHTLFGAFALGAVIPHDSEVAHTLRERLYDFVVVVMLPAYFAFTGLRTQIGLIAGSQWLLWVAIMFVACAGKFGGSAIAARLTGMKWRDAASLGILMNTRGLMELIVLNIGLDLKVISPTCFAMLVLMAVVTTLATTPLLDLVNHGSKPELIAN